MKTTAVIISIFALLGITGTGAWLASSTPGSSEVVEEPQPGLPVNVLTLTAAPSVSRQREYVGSIVAARRTRLAFERSARLIEAIVDEGDVVAKDQVLARIDQRQLNAQVREVKARLRQQRAVLAELESGPRSETIAATTAELAALAADVELRQATLDRTQSLYKRSASSAQTLDEVRLAWKSAAARRDALERQLDELNAGTRIEQVAAQNALIEATEASLERLSIDIRDSDLRAPFAGTVVRRFSDEGDMLSAQQPLFEILETGRLEARIGIPSRFVESLKDHDYFVLTANDLEFTGKLRDVIAQVDQATRTQLVVLSIDAAHPDGIADGQLVRMQMNETLSVEGFQVPVTALATGSRGLWNVYVVEDNKGQSTSNAVVRTRVVEVLHTDGERALIRGAIYEGDRVVVDGLHRIVPGQAVVPRVVALAEKE